MLKTVKLPTREVEIHQYLTSESLKGDKRNHSVPLLDFFPDPLDAKVVIAVLPTLRKILDPPPASVRECIDFVQQTLEVRDISRLSASHRHTVPCKGLAFLHEHDVAHLYETLGLLPFLTDGFPQRLCPSEYYDGRPFVISPRMASSSFLPLPRWQVDAECGRKPIANRRWRRAVLLH